MRIRLTRIFSIGLQNLTMTSILIFSFLVYFLTSFVERSNAQNITVYRKNVPFAPQPLPAPGASNADQIAVAFANLSRTTVRKPIQKITLEGDTYEPEGMVRLSNDRLYVSTTETIVPPLSYGNGTIINGTDRSPGVGFAHIPCCSTPMVLRSRKPRILRLGTLCIT
jgi:hypothetical protein